jgi:hypothetical protein
LVQLLHIRHRLLGRTHVRLGDDFQQRRAGTVQVDAGPTVKILVQRLAGVFLQMGAGDADHLAGAVVQVDGQLAFLDHRQFVLADLVALRQVGIKVILAGEHRAARDFGADGQPEHGRHAHRILVQHRQHPRQAEVDGASLSVGRGAVGGGGPGEDLALGGELGMDFQPDNRFPFHKSHRNLAN